MSIDDAGAIWKHFDLDRWGYRKPVETPKRADRPWGMAGYGYRCVSFWMGGKGFAEMAHRILWAHTFGPIPPGHRIGRIRDGGTHHTLKNLKLATWSHLSFPETDRIRRRRGAGLWGPADSGTFVDKNEESAIRRRPAPDRTPSLEYWPFAQMSADFEPLVVRINASVPKGLPEEIRQEVCQDIAVAVLSGEATIEQIPALVQGAKSRVLRTLWPYFERLSLNAPVSPGATSTFEAFV